MFFFLLLNIEKKLTFFCSIPPAVRPRDYDRTAVMRLIHECMGLPASPPVTSEDSEADGDSPPTRPPAVVQPPVPPPVQSQPILSSQQQLSSQQDQPAFNPQLITIDERTMQLHFTPLYFGKKYDYFVYIFDSFIIDLLEAMANIKNTNEYVQPMNIGLF